MQLVGSECIGTAVDPPIITTRKLSHATQSKQMTTKRRCFSIDDVIGLLDGDDEEVMASDRDEDYEDLMTEESEDEAEANDLDNEVNNTAAAGPCIHGLDANEIVSALDASAEGYTNQDRTGDLQGDAEDPQPSIRRAKRGRKKCTEDVAVCTGTWGGDSQGTGQEMWQYVQEPGEETVRALARRCGSMYRDLGRRQSGHWPGNVAVLTGTWGGDSQGTGQEMWQYVQEPEEETVRALARRCGSTHRDLGRRQSGHWPGDVAVLTGTWGGDSQGTGPEMWQYVQGPGEETVRTLARKCGSTHRDLGRRQSGHWPGDVAVCTGTWGGDSQGTGQEMWQY